MLPTSKLKKLRMSVAGDTMLGRLVDLLQPAHVIPDNEEEALYVKHLKDIFPDLKRVDSAYPFGNLLSIFQNESDVNIINLETAITTHPTKWPHKAFNYRMHPVNVAILQNARIDYCSLANNHVLDYGIQGLWDTMRSLARAGISYAGVGRTRMEASAHCILSFQGLRIALLSASDHPSSWKSISEFNFIDTDAPDMEFISRRVQEAKLRSHFVVFSFHWGPNYQWHPDASIIRLAHALIDLGVDLVHGHSSHHVQGIELYKGRPIFYGCGDFIDDYAVSEVYRNDLGFLYRLEYEIEPGEEAAAQIPATSESPLSFFSSFRDIWLRQQNQGSWRPEPREVHLSRLYLVPTRIERMQVNQTTDPEDVYWLYKNMTRLCGVLGTDLRETKDDKGRPIFEVELGVRDRRREE